MSNSLLWFRLKAALPLIASISISGLLLGSVPALAQEVVAPLAQGEAAPPAAVEVIFTGFARHVDQGASIFVRMTGEVPVTSERVGKRLTYRLGGAKLGVQNNANPLPTEHFGPPVSNIALVQSSAGVDLVIDLSGTPGETAPTHHIALSGGIATLHVELPPASP